MDDIALYGSILEQHAAQPEDRQEYVLFNLQRDRDTPDRVSVLATELSKPDQTMVDIYDYLDALKNPPLPEDPEHRQAHKLRFIKKAMKFFLQGSAMFKRNPTGVPTKCIFRLKKRKKILKSAHERIDHKGEEAIMKTLRKRFYWPSMWNDV